MYIVNSGGQPEFVDAMTGLEGDGPLTLTCYEAISTLNVAARQAYYPNLEAVACTLASDDDDMKEELIQYAKSCVQPGVTYYFNQLTTSMKEPLDAFKAARLFCPVKVQQMKPTISVVDTLSVFPFLSSQIPTLKEMFPLYMVASEDIDPAFLEAAGTVPTHLESGSKAGYLDSAIIGCLRTCVFIVTKLFWRKTKLLPPGLYRGISYDAIQQSLMHQILCTNLN